MAGGELVRLAAIALQHAGCPYSDYSSDAAVAPGDGKTAAAGGAGSGGDAKAASGTAGAAADSKRGGGSSSGDNGKELDEPQLARRAFREQDMSAAQQQTAAAALERLLELRFSMGPGVERRFACRLARALRRAAVQVPAS